MGNCSGGCTFARRSALSAFIAGLLFFVNTGCSRVAADGDSGPSVAPAPPGNRAFNDAARFLAGMPATPGSGYAALENTEAWRKYAAGMSAAWERAEKRRLTPVREFQQKELGGTAARRGFVFYPFSGPDVIYMQGFYPNGNVYVLAGLERPGSIQPPSGFQEENLEAQLDGVRQGSASLFERSFFITAQMSRQLRGQLVDGVLPVILMLLARTGNTIEDVRNVAIDDAGKLVELAQAQPKMGPQPDGLEIRYHKDGERESRKLYYFRLDLGSGLDKNPSFLTFLSQFGQPDTLIKSASFLLHSAVFARLRGYIVDHSRQIVQDDTGVRFAIFQQQRWKVRLYGDYTRPDPPFRARFQPELRAAFDEPGAAREMGFSVGYGIGRRASHLVVAERP